MLTAEDWANGDVDDGIVRMQTQDSAAEAFAADLARTDALGTSVATRLLILPAVLSEPGIHPHIPDNGLCACHTALRKGRFHV